LLLLCHCIASILFFKIKTGAQAGAIKFASQQRRKEEIKGRRGLLSIKDYFPLNYNKHFD
jgi:hypothetical protein